MFQSLRINNPVYIFHKGNTPILETGYVSLVSLPKPKYAVPPTFGLSQEMVVDIIVKVDNLTLNYNSLPALMDVADSFSNGESLVISDSKEAMNAEILSLKLKSQDIVNSIEFHKSLIDNCDKILADFNPEFAEKLALKIELDSLKDLVSLMAASIKELMESNRLLIGHLKPKEIYENVGNLRGRIPLTNEASGLSS